MRIATVVTSLGIGGAEKQALAIAERMAARGHEVVVVALMRQLAAEWPTHLPVVRLMMRRSPASAAAGWLRGWRCLRGFRPDVLHSHSFHANLLTRLIAAAMPRAAVISTVHNVYEGGRLRMAAYRLTDGCSRRTVAVSRAAAERFVRLGAIPAEKCLVRTNGIDTAEFAPDAARRARTREAMGAGSRFVWLSAGRVTPAKDFPNLIAAFELLRGEAPETELWIAGAASETAELPAGATDNGHVRRLGLRRDVAALMDAADGFALGSAWEGMPLVIGEAMAMEKPVVATDVGGVRELAGDAAAVVPAKAPDALAEAMLSVMRRSREERAGAGRAARQRILREFSIEAAADWWEQLYRSLVGDR